MSESVLAALSDPAFDESLGCIRMSAMQLCQLSQMFDYRARVTLGEEQGEIVATGECDGWTKNVRFNRERGRWGIVRPDSEADLNPPEPG